MNAPRSARLLTSVAVSAALVASGCASPGGYTGYGSESETTCVDDLYAPWEQRCPWAKVKTFLVAMTGGLLMGMASGVSRYGVTEFFLSLLISPVLAIIFLLLAGKTLESKVAEQMLLEEMKARRQYDALAQDRDRAGARAGSFTESGWRADGGLAGSAHRTAGEGHPPWCLPEN
jgi:hypothetical protein